MMYGIIGSYRFIYSNFMFKVEGLLDVGGLDYSSTGSEKLNNTDSILFEGRVLFGYHLPVSEVSFVTSYIGVGYRQLESEFDEKFASVDVGYFKTYDYHYIPIGINFSKNLNRRWSYTATAEYDIFLNGKIQYTVMDYSGYGSVIDEVNINQKNGYGLRGSVQMQKQVNQFLSLAVEPFVRYWNIAESDSTDVSYYKGI